MSVDSEYNKSETKMESRIDLEKGTTAQISKEPDCGRWLMAKKAFTVICLVCSCIILSFLTSVVTTKVLLTPLPQNEAQVNGDCIPCDEKTAKGTNNGGTKCCEGNTLPTHAKQVQEMPSAKPRTGAQLSANQLLLQDTPPRLAWSHDGPDDYVEGIKHVTHYYKNQPLDCLEVTQGGRYLTTVQLTYKYTQNEPSGEVLTYFTLTRFRNNQPYQFAKSSHVIPAKDQRSGSAVKYPATMVRSDPFKSGDRICVTVSRPDLLYVSKIDNFFGIVAL